MAEDFVVKTEGDKRRLVINYKGRPYGPDIAQYPQAFQDVIEKLQKVEADEVVLSEYYERIYNEEQTKLLRGIADCITKFETESIWSPSHLGKGFDAKQTAERHDAVLAVLNKCRGDPFGAYMDLLAEIKKQVAYANSVAGNAAALEDVKVYLATLTFMKNSLEATQLIQRMRQYLAQLGQMPVGRGLYMSVFEVSIKPSFIGSRILFTGVETMQLVDQYDVLNSKVYIYKHPDKIEYLYYINPPEYSLPPDKYFLLEKTKEVVAAHRPGSVGFMDMEQARKYFRKIYVATISDLAAKNNIELSVEEKEDLATIVARYTIGYGILEVLLSDRKITDVYIDSPLGVKTVYLVHSKYGQCQTNIIFSEEEARATVSRFRALSGRPFDEAHPILDFDLPDLQTRICTIGKPLAVDGTAFALRLHKDTPWTLCQFMDFKMFPAIAGGIFSFFVDAQASMLIVGSRGAGKCLSGDTLVQLADGRMEKIRDLVESRIAKAKKIIDVGDGVCAECDDLQVLTLTTDLKIKPAPATRVWRRTAPANVYRVKLASGKKIECTPEHPFFVPSGNLILPKRADLLTAGELIATSQATAVNCVANLLSSTDHTYSANAQLSENHVAWDAVTSIEKIPSKEPFVYDLTVEETHSFVANGIIAHNTSFLQAMMQEIPQNLRIIVQEDSVTADSKMLVERAGKLESTTAGELVDGLMREYGAEEIGGKQVLRTNPEGVKVFSYNYSNGKIELAPVTQFTRHKVSKPIYEVETRSGHKLKVTADHSLFTRDAAGQPRPTKTTSLQVGQLIATANVDQCIEAIKVTPRGSLSHSTSTKLEWKELTRAQKIECGECFVYDFSVPGNENFVAENIVAHNTQELPVPALKKLGFNIQRLKTRPPLGGVSEAEVSAEDALRTALRLGDSVLIVGEVRSTEAKALYEAMRVGAVGNVVMGTIHGESAYSIWDRVVNDLGVPTTSFKATDMCIIAAPIRFKGSLKRERRVLEVTEVGKEWSEEPAKEGGFLQWMQFDASKDNLELFKDSLPNSEWIKRVQRNRGMSFEEIWAEINGRAAYKQYLVDQKRKYDVPALLEAENTVRAHNKYMLLEEKQREEIGGVEHESLLKEWRAWVDEELVRPLVALKKK